MIDNLIIVLYFATLLFSGIFTKKAKTYNSFALAGRKLTLIPFTATLVTTSYGWVLGTAELYATYGISAWLFLNLPYTFFSILLALFFAKRTREAEYDSLADLISKHYGQKVLLFAGVFVLLFTSPLMYFHMGAQVFSAFSGFNMMSSLLLTVFFSSFYLYRGGFHTLVKFDIVKFVLMFIGLLLVLLYLNQTFPAKEILRQAKTSILPSNINFSLSYFAGWFFLSSIVLADPNYHQRLNAVDKPKTAINGILLSVICWTIFDFLVIAVVFYASYFNPTISKTDLLLTFANNNLPLGLKGLFFLSLLATIMSTSDSFLFVSAQTFSKIYLPYFVPHNLEQTKRYKLSIFIISICSILFLLFYFTKSVVLLFFDITPYAVSCLLVPVIMTYIPRYKLSPQLVFLQMFLSVIICFLSAQFFTQYLNPVIWGTLTSVFTHIILYYYFMKKHKS